jgi:hypothetical protein
VALPQRAEQRDIWRFEYFTERIGGPAVFEAVTSGPRR